MKSANIATAKNQFSRLIERVKHGEVILITERDRPVALLQPLDTTDPSLMTLQASGLLNPSNAPLDMAAFIAAPRPALSPDHSLRGAILLEREESR